MESFEALFARLQELFGVVGAIPEPHRSDVIDLLDAIDDLHASAIQGLVARLDPQVLDAAAQADPAVAWLVEAYELSSGPRRSVPVEISRRPPKGSQGS